MDLNQLPYLSRRSPVLAAHGMVATSQPLCAQAGVAVLQAGGNAVDAAVATAAMMTVVEPTTNGLGSDAFALIWDGSKLHGYNGSGRAPSALTPERVRAAGHTAMPQQGWFSVTVPGAPRTWADLTGRFGTMDLPRLLEPAISAARDGYPVAPVTARLWANRQIAQRRLQGPEFQPWFDVFAPGGVTPAAGDIWQSQGHARTLERIAATNADAFYTGDVAAQFARFAAETGGFISKDDLAEHTGSWVDPICTSYHGHEVWEIPPNGAGLAALIALNILEDDSFGLGQHPRESADAYHVQIEAIKLAMADTGRYIADPDRVDVPTQGLLSKEYAAQRRALIGPRAEAREAGEPQRGGTIYLCTADKDGMMVSYIQSNYSGFGSGVVVPGAGIALQNRAWGFSLDDGHPNVLAPGKRPYHTIIPGFLTRNGEAVGPFGVMGAHTQPQAHVQVIAGTVDWHLNPQAVLDMPRWVHQTGLEISLEAAVSPEIVDGLLARGHQLSPLTAVQWGRGQIIWRLPSGALAGGSEPRADGAAIGY